MGVNPKWISVVLDPHNLQLLDLGIKSCSSPIKKGHLCKNKSKEGTRRLDSPLELLKERISPFK
ncbi:hypothetical protein QJS10_CPA05g02440 [Acorus calamus]|uniref:Uncharacterized protein n=1 Tax=Acorus calamus TaxID=4465 RepID=A0AAV9EUR4_ACOCL|nr:hypothetical protein QJS10_CPA05g02440 [Acorus calamus]